MPTCSIQRMYTLSYNRCYRLMSQRRYAEDCARIPALKVLKLVGTSLFTALVCALIRRLRCTLQLHAYSVTGSSIGNPLFAALTRQNHWMDIKDPKNV